MLRDFDITSGSFQSKYTEYHRGKSKRRVDVKQRKQRISKKTNVNGAGSLFGGQQKFMFVKILVIDKRFSGVIFSTIIC